MDSSRDIVYRIHDIEIDASRCCLKHNGKEQPLRQQAFDVLLYLVERHHRLVGKDELIQIIWHETAVTDNALVQCIAEVRKALGDDPRQPRFIKTVPKLGYRFVGPVEERRASELVAMAPPLSSEYSSGRAPRRYLSFLASGAGLGSGAGTRIARGLLVAGLLAATIALPILFWKWLRPESVQGEVTLPQLPGKKTVAVMYFENRSGKEDLKWLREGIADMLITDLARSDQITLLTRQQLFSLLERSGHKSGTKIRLDEAREIARRARAEAFVTGVFWPENQRIRVDVQLYDTQGPRLITQEQLILDTPSQIFTQIDLLSQNLAAQLGVAPLDQGKMSLAEAMTDNLESYRYYSLGVEKARSLQNEQAIRFLKKAIDLDPRFAMAYARIGYVYAVTDFIPDRGIPYLEKAFQLSSRLTEKDKLNLMAWYAIARSDYPAAVLTFQQIIAEYPQEIEAYSRLGRLLLGEEQAEKALNVLNRGLTIDPEAKNLYNVLGVVLLSVGRCEEAIAAHQHFVALAPRDPNAHDSLGMSYQRAGRYDEAIAEYQSALMLDPDFEPAMIHLGDAHFQAGRYQGAIRHYLHYARVSHSSLARAFGYAGIAHVYLKKGDMRHAEEAAQTAMKYDGGVVWTPLVLALQRRDFTRVDALKQRLFERLPSSERGARQDLRTQAYFRGYIELKKGNADAAIDHFRDALRHLPATSAYEWHEDCLADAYLELGRLDQAIVEYNRILGLNPNYPFVQYHLAQAYAQKGDREKSQLAYERFLQSWKHADQDLPEIIEAKRKFRRVDAVARKGPIGPKSFSRPGHPTG